MSNVMSSLATAKRIFRTAADESIKAFHAHQTQPARWREALMPHARAAHMAGHDAVRAVDELLSFQFSGTKGTTVRDLLAKARVQGEYVGYRSSEAMELVSTGRMRAAADPLRNTYYAARDGAALIDAARTALYGR